MSPVAGNDVPLRVWALQYVPKPPESVVLTTSPFRGAFCV